MEIDTSNQECATYLSLDHTYYEQLNSLSTQVSSSTCNICNRKFSNVQNYRRHLKTFNHNNMSAELKCCACQSSFSTRKMFIEHLNIDHPEKSLKIEKHVFKTCKEFDMWKLHMEKETNSFYGKQTPYKTNTSRTQIYTCHRSGKFDSKGTGKRHLKVNGSNKCGFYCPARIKNEMQLDSNGEIISCNVEFISTHMGHECDVGRQKLTKEEKDYIAGQLYAGIPATRILDNISKTASKDERLASTTSQDLRNISASYCLNKEAVRDNQDVISVDCFVKEMEDSEDNPILIYKCCGEINENFPSLSKDDFVLGYMNAAQEELFNIYGKEIILIDSTHGTNKYNIQLTSIMVKDDSWEGLPVAFLWSNRQTEEIYKHFLNAIKERIKEMKSKTFMSDDFPAFYNAWNMVFGPTEYHLICDWHVKRAWAKNVSTGSHRIKNLEKQKQVLSELHDISNETDRVTFQCILDIKLNEWLQDPETCSFGMYFSSTYKHRSEMWAACHRIGANINTNMTVERWHKDLKYNSDLKGKCGGRLDKAIQSLITSLRKKLMDRLSTLTRGKLTKKMIETRRRHKIAEQVLEEVDVFQEEENTNEWLVPSFHEIGEIYKVKVLSTDSHHTCNMKCTDCNMCLHQIVCSCADSSIKYNFCKHMHIVCLKNKNICRSQVPEKASSSSHNCVQRNREKEAIGKELYSENTNKLQEQARSAVSTFLARLNEPMSDKSLKEIIHNMHTLSKKCDAIETSEKTLPPVIEHSAPSKRIIQQRQFPIRKKRAKLTLLHRKGDVLKAILNQNK